MRKKRTWSCLHDLESRDKMYFRIKSIYLRISMINPIYKTVGKGREVIKLGTRLYRYCLQCLQEFDLLNF